MPATVHPEPIPFDEAKGKYVESLIKLGDEVALKIDESHYPVDAEGKPKVGFTRPENPLALAVEPRPWARWHAGALSVMRTVTGSEKHPFVLDFLRHAEESVVDHVRRGTGILEAFLDAWRAGCLWPVTSGEEPKGVQQP